MIAGFAGADNLEDNFLDEGVRFFVFVVGVGFAVADLFVGVRFGVADLFAGARFFFADVRFFFAAITLPLSSFSTQARPNAFRPRPAPIRSRWIGVG